VIVRWFPEKGGLALGITSVGVGFGGLLVAPLGNALIASYGWRNTFVILGLASVVILLVCSHCRSSRPMRHSGDCKSERYGCAEEVKIPP
jgi:MFS transporter, OFA family, oxalate/formate antiporter